MTDGKGATQMSYEEGLKLALLNFDPYNVKIIGLALNKIRYVLEKEGNPKDPKKDKTKDPKKGHHVVNKGVNDLHKDIIKAFFENFWNLDDEGISTSPTIIRECVVKKDGMIFHISKHTINSFLLTDPLTDIIKDKINKMTAEKPNDVEYENENAREFSCAKLVLLACVHCVMLDIHRRLQNREGMPDPINDYLKSLREIINNKIIEKGDYGVYVDSKVKQWWEAKNPGEVKVFKDCEKSVKRFFGNIAENFELVIHWGQWFYRLKEILRDGDITRIEILGY